MGGITAAAHLAQHGLKVTVLEKNARPGGRCDRLSRDGHHFDTGPTLLIMPHVYEDEFAGLGASLHESLDLQRVDPTYRLVFDDGSDLALSSDLKAMYSQLEAIEPGSFKGYLRYLDEGCQHYDHAMKRLVNRDFRSPGDFFNLRNVPPLSNQTAFTPLQPYGGLLRWAAVKIRVYLSGCLYGVKPVRGPSDVFDDALHRNRTWRMVSAWRDVPRGGRALMDIAQDAGVEFIFDAAVKQIELNGKQAKGVILEDDQRLAADAVLANADLPYVYRDLLPGDRQAERLAHKRYSCSVISFFWGVDRPYPELGPHTLFLADDYRANFDEIIHDLTVPTNPSLYVHAPARLDPRDGAPW